MTAERLKEAMTFEEFNNGAPPCVLVRLYHDPDNAETAPAERASAADRLREIADRLEEGDYGVGNWEDTYAFCVARDL